MKDRLQHVIALTSGLHQDHPKPSGKEKSKGKGRKGKAHACHGLDGKGRQGSQITGLRCSVLILNLMTVVGPQLGLELPNVLF